MKKSLICLLAVGALAGCHTVAQYNVHERQIIAFFEKNVDNAKNYKIKKLASQATIVSLAFKSKRPKPGDHYIIEIDIETGSIELIEGR